ncbi:MAG: tetratricopeptide repeat protein [Bdellovibrionales bacterium]|nr:tetratricopeptide repeat protein [Bdellovibrionales bacterium]
MKFTYIFLILVAMIFLYYSPNIVSSIPVERTAEEHLESGKAFLAEDNLWKAREAFRLAIKHDPNNAEAYFLRGTSQMALNYFNDAVSDFSHALQLNPSNGNAYYNRGLALAKSGNIKAAIEDFDKAISINPGDVAAYRDRGVAKQRLDDRIGALEDFRTATELNGNFSAAQVSYGNLLLELGKVEEGLERLNAAVALDPSLKATLLESTGCGATWSHERNEVEYRDCR